MAIWKRISVSDLARNRNNLDIRKMYKAGAIREESSYPALVVEDQGNRVMLLARLEIGFEEYIVLDRPDYDRIPIMSNESGLNSSAAG